MFRIPRWLRELGLVDNPGGPDVTVIELQRVEQRFGLWYKSLIVACGLFLLLSDPSGVLKTVDYLLIGFFVLAHLAYVVVLAFPVQLARTRLETVWLSDSVIRLAFAGYVVGTRYTGDVAVILMFPLVIVGILVGQPRLKHLLILGTAAWFAYSAGAYYNGGRWGIGTSLYWREAVLNALLFIGGVVLVRQVSHLTGLATTDALTGLGNRRLLDLRLREEVARAQRTGATLSLVMLDLDDFKSVNDRLGHLAGDTALVKVAEVIQQGVRNYDVACRYGGDEFVVILPHTNVQHALSIAHRLIEGISNLGAVGSSLLEHDVRLSASAGVATYPKHANTAETLLKQADYALVFGAKKTKGVVVSSVD